MQLIVILIQLQKLLKFGKYGRMFTPIGAGITAAGLGIDAYKIARDEYQKMQGMTEQENILGLKEHEILT